jgi:ammonium transporter Rh
MIGTTFLYMYWPSFNAVLGEFSSEQQRAIINTLLANSTSCITACMFSRITKKYLDMIVVINATLAGGVAIGASANLVNYPFCAMIIGFVAGMVSSLGYIYMNDFLKSKLRLHDS